MRLLIPAVAGLGLAMFVTGLLSPRFKRLEARVAPYLSGLQGRPSGLLRRSNPNREIRDRFETRIRRLLPYSYEDIQSRLDAAGDDRRPEDFRIEQLLWAVTAAVTVSSILSLTAFSGIALDLRAATLLVIVAAITAFLARDWHLGSQVAVRRSLIVSELPIALDLVALAIMAGESVPAAFQRVAARLGEGLGREFRAVVADIRAGSQVIEAVEGLSRRVPDPGLARFVDAVCTGIERGAPLSDVLRAQADDARDARRRQLLELGGQKEVWMLVPVVFLIMPVVVLFALYPGLVSLNLLVP